MIGGGSVDDKEPVQPQVLTPEEQAELQQQQAFMQLIYNACMAALRDFFTATQHAAKSERDKAANAALTKSLLDKKITL